MIRYRSRGAIRARQRQENILFLPSCLFTMYLGPSILLRSKAMDILTLPSMLNSGTMSSPRRTAVVQLCHKGNRHDSANLYTCVWNACLFPPRFILSSLATLSFFGLSLLEAKQKSREIINSLCPDGFSVTTLPFVVVPLFGLLLLCCPVFVFCLLREQGKRLNPAKKCPHNINQPLQTGRYN